ncbi:MAG: phosphotransferase-like protein [Acholeplasmataceae bacterium]
MIVLVGASASGKTELAKCLFELYGYKKCITTTTRQPRAHEKDGHDYHFLSQEAFIDKQKADAFVEVTTYQNAYYGIQKKDIQKNGVVILDPFGANALIKHTHKDVFLCFVFCDIAVRKSRMESRGDHLCDIIKRLEEDQVRFQAHKIDRIDLTIDNSEGSLINQAKQLHQAYQYHLKSK